VAAPVVAVGAAGAAEAAAGAPPEEMTNAIDAQPVASTTKTRRILLKLSTFGLTNAACNRRGEKEFPSTSRFRSSYDISARDTPTSVWSGPSSSGCMCASRMAARASNEGRR
jgi:hypothetical protein